MSCLNPGAYQEESCCEAEPVKRLRMLESVSAWGNEQLRGLSQQDMGRREGGINSDEKRRTSLLPSLQKEDMHALETQEKLQMVARLVTPHNQAMYLAIKIYFILF